MPILTIEINRPVDKKQCTAVINKGVDLLAEMLEKPKGSIMVNIKPDANLVLGDSDEPAALIEFKLFDFQGKAAEYIKGLTSFVENELGVAPDRQFQEFTEMKPEMFGWNGNPC